MGGRLYMEMKKTSLQLYIIKFVFKIGISILGILLVSLIIFNNLFKYRILLPANYSEQLIKNSKAKITNAKKVTSKLIPQDLKYIVLNKKNLRVVSGTMKQSEVEKVKNFITGQRSTVVGTNGYDVIERPQEYCIIHYQLIVQFSNQTFRKLIPYPGIFGAGILVITLLITLYCFTKGFSNKMKEELNKFSLVTEKIRQQDLDFETQTVYYVEHQKVMDSLDNLRLSLKKSLTIQFEQEKRKQEQISALAHDIKIPLTIIKGNAELLNITQKDKIVLDYTNEIMEASEQIQQYTQLLIDTSQNYKIHTMHKEEININAFIDIIQKDTLSSIGKRNIDFKIDNSLPKYIICNIDLQSMERAFMNIIINALDHTPEQATLSLKVYLKDNLLSFVITDSGKGFTSESIIKAKEMFYTANKSRSQTGHYGIGLAFADKAIQAHNGALHLQNDPDTCGGQVLIELSIS